MVSIEINGIKREVPQGSMIIEAADQCGIQIPRFCYHKKLSVAANCRMCLVEVENAPKPLPACATPVTDGMKVLTQSHKAIEAQKSVMEFLLINHPLDCPICDQGGECELQDVAVGYGDDVSRYTEGKRVVKDKNIGPLIATDMTRCIHCTRCVRFGTEIAGLRELGATGRGEHTEIATFLENSIDSELSGNVIDVCPVGALTSKPFRFTARTWELRQQKSVSPHDCVGSNLFIHTRNQQVMRIVPRENEEINEVWISDRDRFSYPALRSNARLTAPMIRENGVLKVTDWATAFDTIKAKLQSVIEAYGADSIGGLLSSSSTVEEAYLFQKWLRALGVNNIDCRLREQDFSDQARRAHYPSLGVKISELENQQALLVVGGNLRKEQPLLNHRIRKAALKGAETYYINPIDYPMNFDPTIKFIPEAGNILDEVAATLKAALKLKGSDSIGGVDSTSINQQLASVNVQDSHEQVAAGLINSEKSIVVMGLFAVHHSQAALLRTMLSLLGQITGAQFGELSDGANSAGCWISGAVPHRDAKGEKLTESGLNSSQMFTSNLKAYVCMQVEPELDSVNSANAIRAMQEAEFVVQLASFRNDSIDNAADVILPIAPYAETGGTYVNIEGVWQTFLPATQPLGESRPGWKILRVLGNWFECENFDYQSLSEVLAEVKQLPRSADTNFVLNNSFEYQASAGAAEKLTLLFDWAPYAVDAITRQAQPLQQTLDMQAAAKIQVNSKQALQLKLAEGDSVKLSSNSGKELILPLMINDAVPDAAVYLLLGHEAVSGLAAEQHVQLHSVGASS